MRLKGLREHVAKLGAAIKLHAETLESENRNPTASEAAMNAATFDAYKDAKSRLDAEDRAAGGNYGPPRTSLGNSAHLDVAAMERARVLALGAWLGVNVAGFELTDEHVEACQAFGIKPTSKSLDLHLSPSGAYQEYQEHFRNSRPESRRGLKIGAASMSVGTGSTGGSLVPPGELLGSLEENMLWFGGARQVGETIRTDTGEPLQWPSADDTGNTGELLGEGASTTGTAASTSPVVALMPLGAYKFSAKPVRVSSELLQDSKFGIGKILGGMLGERLGRATNTYFTTGTGTSQPQGIVTGASLGATSGSATQFTADDIIKLYHSVDPAYRNGAGFMCNDAVIAYIRQLKDGQGQYLWRSGLESGRPDTLLGCQITPNNDMNATFTTGLKMLLFGQLNKFKIRTVGKVRVVRLDELYADTDQVGFNAFSREDSRVLNAGTAPIKYLKLA
jgi:HK97 family phage major capsid protein